MCGKGGEEKRAGAFSRVVSSAVRGEGGHWAELILSIIAGKGEGGNLLGLHQGRSSSGVLASEFLAKRKTQVTTISFTF